MLISNVSAKHSGYLVTQDFAFGIVLEVTITFESSFDELSKLDGECFVIEKVMNPQPRSRRLPRVRWTNTLLGGTDAKTW